jgi:hypothetical protein
MIKQISKLFKMPGLVISGYAIEIGASGREANQG